MKKIPDFTSPVFKKTSDLSVRISQIPPMDVAFQTMALSEYELLVATIHKLNELVSMTNSYSSLIDEILKWVVGDGVELAVKDKLTEWLNDGTLETVINDTLFKSKLDKDVFETFQNDIFNVLSLKVDGKLDVVDFETFKNSLTSNTLINPDVYEGNDVSKITQALNHLISVGGGTIKLLRMFDLTGLTSIKLEKVDYKDRTPLVFQGEGGGFVKNDRGYMFSSLSEDVGDITFNHVHFKSKEGVGAKVIDADKLIRINFNNCHFRDIDTIILAETRFVQTISFMGGSAVGGMGSLLKAPCFYDFTCSSGFFVEHRENFFEQIESVNEWKALNGVRFTDIMVEGLSGFAFKILRAESLKIDSVYLEGNGSYIDMSNADFLDGVQISNCRFDDYVGTEKVAIAWGQYIFGASSHNNFSRYMAMHDTTKMVKASIYNVYSHQDIALGGSRNKIANIDPNGQIVTHNKEDEYNITNKKTGEYIMGGYNSDSDLNYHVDSGSYHKDSSSLNIPVAVYGILEVQDFNNYIFQRFTARPAGNVYNRFRENNEWSDWKEVGV